MKWIQMVVCVANVIVKKLLVHIDILRFRSQVLYKIQVMWHHHNVDLPVQQCRKCGIHTTTVRILVGKFCEVLAFHYAVSFYICTHIMELLSLL